MVFPETLNVWSLFEETQTGTDAHALICITRNINPVDFPPVSSVYIVKWEGITLTVLYYQSNGTPVSASWLWVAHDGDFSIIQVSSFHDRVFKKQQLDLNNLLMS